MEGNTLALRELSDDKGIIPGLGARNPWFFWGRYSTCVDGGDTAAALRESLPQQALGLWGRQVPTLRVTF